MAAARPLATVPIGSALWIQHENDQLSQFLSQEAEDFGFAARNEAEWLNEHMAEVFAKNQVYETPCAQQALTADMLQKRYRDIQDPRQATRQNATDNEEAKCPRKPKGALSPSCRWECSLNCDSAINRYFFHRHPSKP